jgi:hypothetical protein
MLFSFSGHAILDFQPKIYSLIFGKIKGESHRKKTLIFPLVYGGELYSDTGIKCNILTKGEVPMNNL